MRMSEQRESESIFFFFDECAFGAGVRGLGAQESRVAVSLGLKPQRLLTFHLVHGSASLRNDLCPFCPARLSLSPGAWITIFRPWKCFFTVPQR